MMDDVTDYALRAFLAARKDIFGEEASFLHLKSEQNSNSSGGGKSNSLFGRIVYKTENEIRLSQPLILKCTSPASFISAMSSECLVGCNMEFINEIIFYTQLSPFFSSLRDISHLFAKYFFSHLSISPNVFEGVIIFENLQAAGFTTCKKISFLDYDHLALMMRKLGEFHAYSYEARRTHSDHFSALVSSVRESKLFYYQITGNMSAVNLRRVESLRNDDRYSFKVAELEKLMKSSTEFIKKIVREGEANPLAVLCHGEYAPFNILFKYENDKPVDLKIVDLGTCKLASPVVDLAMVLYLNADQRMRDSHWDDLIGEYYTTLKYTFPSSEVPSKDSILGEFKGKAVAGFFLATFILDLLLALDNNLPTFQDLLPANYKDFPLCNIPLEVFIQTKLISGGQLCTEALMNILKDMIDRGFL